MIAKELIMRLNLEPHPEGGFYRQTYKSEESTNNRNGDKRSVCTSIYYLLKGHDKSHFHRIQSDEMWYYHLGESLEIIYISDGGIEKVILGPNIHSGEVLSFRIPATTWFAAKLIRPNGFILVSCTVAPGFEYDDFELGKRETLIMDYPELKTIIEEFTRE